MTPTLEEFLAASADEIAGFTPATILFASANARRTAALNGVNPQQYLQWITQQMANVIPPFFRLGVQHLVMPTLGGTQLEETMSRYKYGSQVIDWIEYYSCSPESDVVKAAQEQGFRIRLMGSAVKSIPKLGDIDKRLRDISDQISGPILWLYVVGHKDEPWKEVLDTARQHMNASREELVKILYGEHIPPIKIFIGSGRWIMKPEIVPLLLNDDEMQCYWAKGPDIMLTEDMIRRDS